MDKIGAFEAKTHLSQLLSKAEQGTCFQILRRGKPVAQLVGIRDTARADRIHEALAFFSALRKRTRVSAREVRNWIRTGRH